ncbi:SUN domain-containing protein 2-like [Bombus bifarius]|uniref:SUN domain-containing protein 2-like n=1 Tax=Bombus bifarius TaxID=103933 RepID=A0A6P8NM95_9HYME|nr:SUN domain-containing protein 2-like [Bombus bifarius]XP_033315487.1 SUN domain-containing protein 2-like [Bombus bifarius]
MELQKKKILTQNGTPNKGVNKKSLVNNGNVSSETSHADLDLKKGCSNDEITNKSQQSIISVRKIEDLCRTPQKSNTLGGLGSIENIQIENVNSPKNFTPNSLGINLMKWHSQTETPSKHKRKRQYLCNEHTSERKIKRELCSDNDYDQLSDAVKLESCDNELNDLEAIDMLHDLDSVMDFEESKIDTDIFCSTINETMQDNQTIETSRDPEVDPLYITDNEETSTPHKNIKNQETSVENKIRMTGKHKCNKEDTDNDYDDLKYILGELDIEMPLEDEEEEEEEEREEREEEEEEEEEEVEEKEEKNELSEDAMKKLYKLKVKLMHKVPKQHKIEHTAGSKTLTRREKELFLKHGPLKSGIFTPSEDKIIKDNWKAFCKAHDWNPKCVKPFIHMKHANRFYIKSMEERQKFTQFLANNLPWRTLYSVFHRFKHLYGNHEKIFQRYTSVEDKKILSYMKNKQNEEKVHRFSELSKMLGRSRHSIWSRYQLLKKMQQDEDPSSEIKWTLSLIGKFIKTLMSITLCETVEDLKDAIIPKPVWRKLEEKLGIHHNTLKKFWIFQLHMQLFCPEPIYLNDIKIKLIEYIYGKGISNSREIVWSNVAKYFDGVTNIFLCKIFFYLVQEAALKINTKNFTDIVEYLYNEKIQDIKNELTDKFLPRLFYNGKVKIIDEDLNEDISI